MPNDMSTGLQLGAPPRMPPCNLQAEQALLGAILANNRAYDAVSDFLKPEHFADQVNGRIFRAAQERISAGRVADAVSLKSDFEHSGVLHEVGGTTYLTQLLTAMVGILNAKEYGALVFDLWQRREAIRVAEELANNAYDGTQPITDLSANAAATLDDLSRTDSTHCGTYLADAMEEAITRGAMAAKGEGLSDVRFGLPSLDALFGDLEPGGVYVLSGEPGDGKSALALQIADSNSKRGVPVGYFSTEMQAAQLGRRALALNSGVPTKVLKAGAWNEFENRRITDAWAAEAGRRGLFLIEDVPSMNMRIIGARARAFARKKREEAEKHNRNEPDRSRHMKTTGLIVVDHMHDLSEFSEAELTRAVGAICRGAKTVVKQTRWPMLLLAQMSRASDRRENRRPLMSDLYGGRQIEAVAEGIILLHRPEKDLDPFEPERRSGETDDRYNERHSKWEADQRRWKGITLGYCPKVRDGAPGVVAWRFDGPTNRFSDTEMPTGAGGGCG